MFELSANLHRSRSSRSSAIGATRRPIAPGGDAFSLADISLIRMSTGSPPAVEAMH